MSGVVQGKPAAQDEEHGGNYLDGQAKIVSVTSAVSHGKDD